jgi:DNA-binding CsgD family transcriptional regulator
MEQRDARYVVKPLTSEEEPCDAVAKRIRLSARQRQILALVAEGATDNEIALRLGLSSTTVSQYMKKIRERLGACSRAHAVALALRQGILETHPSQHEDT